MYYPYLRGKQFELIALREFAQQIQQEFHVCPIIEPVKLGLNSLKMAINVFFSNSFCFALILNPGEGDFKRQSANFIEDIEDLRRNVDKWIPAFIYRNNPEAIIEMIDAANLSNVMLIFHTSVDFTEPKVESLVQKLNIKYVVADFNRRNTKRQLKYAREKSLIRIDDKFNELPRNADYLSVPEELFTEEHHYYKEDRFSGFSDYTVLPSSFKESGMLPYAVAIHMTYEKTPEEIYIRHFVSDSNEDNTNIQGKFQEADAKLELFYRTHKKTTASTELIQMLQEGHYPGLGVVKKLSIKNHLELIEDILSKSI